MQIVTTLSFDQFRAAVLAMRKQFRQQSKRTYWLRIAFIVVVSFSISIAVQAYNEQLWEFLVIAGTVAILFGMWRQWQSNVCLRKTYEAQKKQLNGQVISIDESGISGHWENGDATYRYNWSAFESFVELPDSLVFFPNTVSFVRVPTQALTLDEQEAIKQWAAQRRNC